MEHPRLEELIATLELLRAPGGCAWDAEQTHESLVRYLLEETYELVEAIESSDDSALIEELGDVLYQVLFHSDIAAAEGRFTLEDVAAHMNAKMIGRHPHVFGSGSASTSASATTAAEVVALWDEVKKIEKPSRTSVLDGVPQAMPSLLLADKLLGKGSYPPLPVPASEEELGALLLGLVSGARASGLDAERALRSALRTLQDDIRAGEAASPTAPIE